jgi:hypothetical protein
LSGVTEEVEVAEVLADPAEATRGAAVVTTETGAALVAAVPVPRLATETEATVVDVEGLVAAD